MTEYYSISKAAKILNVCDKTLRNWDKDGSFIPDRRVGDHGEHMREYSREQLEKKLGKPIEFALDPVLELGQKGLESLIWLAKERTEVVNPIGNTLKEKYHQLYIKIVQKSSELWRANGSSPANYIVCSPELEVWFQTCAVGYTPKKPTNTTIRLLGTINCRWHLYTTTLVEPDTVIMGVKTGRELRLNKDSVAVIKVPDFIF